MKSTTLIVCVGVIAFAIIVTSCLGQDINLQDDSPIDPALAAPAKSAPRPIDTVNRQEKIVGPDSADTIPRQNETTSVSPDTLVQQHENIKPDIAGPVPFRNTKEAPLAPEVHDLSPFSSDQVHCVGISLDYFSYGEVLNLNDIFPDYPYGYPQNFVQGTPKSTEYGLLFGFDYQGSIRKHGSSILFRPNLDIQIGIHQTYDGSSQPQALTRRINDTLLDTIGFQYLPAKFYKSNYFVQAGLDIGFCRTHATVPFYLYSGIRGKLWYRNMLPDTTSYSNQITSAEMYYWFSAPLGLALSMPVSPDLAFGLDASCDLMFNGQMQLLLSSWDSEHTYKTITPTFTLGNRAGFRFEFSITYKSANETVYQFAPYFTRYSFGQSEYEIAKSYTDGNYMPNNDETFSEPSSATWLLGVKFRIVFMSPYTHTR